jgi:hypothetical protein
MPSPAHDFTGDYSPALHMLLRAGDPIDCWLPEPRVLGLDTTHVSELITLMTDMRLHQLPRGAPGSFAPVHALRVLVALGAVEAVQPGLELMTRLGSQDPIGFRFELSGLGLLGPAALPMLEAYVADPEPSAELRRHVAAAFGIIRIEASEDTEELLGVALRRLLAPGNALPEPLLQALEWELAVLEDPTAGLDPDCPLCQMLIAELEQERGLSPEATD